MNEESEEPIEDDEKLIVFTDHGKFEIDCDSVTWGGNGLRCEQEGKTVANFRSYRSWHWSESSKEL